MRLLVPQLIHAEMAQPLPSRLSALLGASSPDAREAAWEAFVGEFSKILLHATRHGSSSYDETMDRYAYALDQLRSDDCRRLRAFSANGRAEFPTWLFVVTRRLCVDHHRRQFGRPRNKPSSEGGSSPEQAARHRLAYLLSEELDLDRVPDPSTPDPETNAWIEERRRALEEAVASLQPRDQLLITFRFVDDLSVREISRVMRFRSPFQVYRRLDKILKTLRLGLRDRGISEP